MANVLGTLFGDIADAIRTKTGETGAMKPAEFAEKIAGIAVDGSGGAVVYWVTFMNGDTELFKMPVLAGDDCKDPLATGDIARPTKESTVSQVFAYSGWSATDGGAADSTLLKAVTGDKTVWAAYTATARTYTVRFYDGETLLQSMPVAYGSMPAVANPSKDGYSFDAWMPELARVTGDADYYAQWTEKLTFAGGTWADIAAVSEAGQAAEYFKIGDTKTIAVGDSTLELILIGFNHDTLADGSGKAGMTIVATTALADTMPLSDWGVLASAMKSVLKPQLPSDLQAVIKPVIKQCDVALVNQVVTPINVEFDLFPLSFAECMIQRHSGRLYTDSDWTKVFTPLGTAYEYFANNYLSGYYYGPRNTFLGTDDLGFWYRQWIRATSPPSGMYNDTYFSTTSSKYASTASRTENKTVMLAFCI